jgi:hypothetical protein
MAITLKPEQRRAFFWIFLAGALAIAFCRAIIPVGVTSSGVYVYLPMTMPLIGGAIGVALRLGPGQDKPNLWLGLFGGVLTLLIWLITEYIFAVRLDNEFRRYAGEALLPVLQTPRETLVTLLLYLANQPLAAVMGLIGAGVALLMNVVYSRTQFFKPRV